MQGCNLKINNSTVVHPFQYLELITSFFNDLVAMALTKDDAGEDKCCEWSVRAIVDNCFASMVYFYK